MGCFGIWRTPGNCCPGCGEQAPIAAASHWPSTHICFPTPSQQARHCEEWLTSEGALPRASSMARSSPARGRATPNDAAIYEIRASNPWPLSREYTQADPRDRAPRFSYIAASRCSSQ